MCLCSTNISVKLFYFGEYDEQILIIMQISMETEIPYLGTSLQSLEEILLPEYAKLRSQAQRACRCAKLGSSSVSSIHLFL